MKIFSFSCLFCFFTKIQHGYNKDELQLSSEDIGKQNLFTLNIDWYRKQSDFLGIGLLEVDFFLWQKLKLSEFFQAIHTQPTFEGIFSCFIREGTEFLDLCYYWIFQDYCWSSVSLRFFNFLSFSNILWLFYSIALLLKSILPIFIVHFFSSPSIMKVSSHTFILYFHAVPSG